MIETQYKIDHLPSAVRYPRGSGYGEEVLKDIFGESGYVAGELPARGQILPIGKGRLVKKGTVRSIDYSSICLNNSSF